jgi:SWI/SNF-related matrix-associated actin-dependent regulator 1 of chromatin subfamily A
MDIQTLVNWSEPKEVNTKYGPKLLRTANATPEFWEAWKNHKEDLKAAGISCTRDGKGNWSATWWADLSDDVKAQRAAAVEASRATSAAGELPHPAGLDYMPFQKAGIAYALGRRGVLIADEMGLGKTIQAIGIINAEPAITSAVIVCPKSLKLNWQRELEKWLTKPMSIAVVNGKGWIDADIVIMNYESLSKYEKELRARTWGALILDEAHYIKNAKTARSEFIKGRQKKADAHGNIIKKEIKPIPADRHIRLTGTPIVNRPAELYNLISDLANFGSFMSFARRYCGAKHSGFGWDFTGASNLDELQRRLRESVMVRRLKVDVLTELPKKIRQVIEVEPDSAEMKKAIAREQEYSDISDDRLADLRALVELSKAESDEAYRSAVMRLREASAVDFEEMARIRHETALAKLPVVIDHIRQALEDNDNKIIVAAHHHDVIDGLGEALAEFNPVTLTGETKELDRLAAVDAFQNNPAVRIFIGSIKAAGVGLTLTASAHVVFAELDWVPGNITQMEDRAHRIGQTETVLIQHIVLAGSLDARIAHTLVAKQRVIDDALDKDHPERTAPVYVPKEKPATQDTRPDALALIGEKLSAEQITLIHAGLRMLAGLDIDGARELNNVGFNKIDSGIGRTLAERSSLSPKQAALGAKLVKKYHRQLPAEVIEAATV